MPLYEYECEACGQRFELIRKFSDPPAEICAKCGKGPIRRLPSSPAIQFKGSGFYITDYAQKGKGDTAGKRDTAEKGDTAGKPAGEAKSTGSDSTPAGSDTAASKSDTSKPASTPPASKD